MKQDFVNDVMSRISPEVYLYEAIKTTLPKLIGGDVYSIIAAYSEPWRKYHNCNHILQMLNFTYPGYLGEELGLNSKNRKALRTMIIFHDIVYKLGREKGWNESESANFARSCLTRYSNQEDQEFLDLVCAGILATATHDLCTVKRKHQKLVCWLIDIDLFVGFGANWEEFESNTLLIAEEYSPLYTREEYYSGRAKFAKVFLERENIFHTEHFAQYEQVVRENLTRIAKGS